MAKQSKIDRDLTKWVNSLSVEQMTKLYDVIQPVSKDDPIHQMSDDELLNELLR